MKGVWGDCEIWEWSAVSKGINIWCWRLWLLIEHRTITSQQPSISQNVWLQPIPILIVVNMPFFPSEVALCFSPNWDMKFLPSNTLFPFFSLLVNNKAMRREKFSIFSKFQHILDEVKLIILCFWMDDFPIVNKFCWIFYASRGDFLNLVKANFFVVLSIHGKSNFSIIFREGKTTRREKFLWVLLCVLVLDELNLFSIKERDSFSGLSLL